MDSQHSISSESDDRDSSGPVSGYKRRGSGAESSRKKWSADDEEEYKRRRARNNEAVRKCRVKSRQKSKEMADKVNLLREENEMLSQKVVILTKELTLLKDMFLTHAAGPKAKAAVASKLLLANSMAAISDHGYVKNEIIDETPTETPVTAESIVDLSMHSRPGIVIEKAVKDEWN